MKHSVWTILVPTKMNNKPIRPRHHKEWDKKVQKITDGLTITPPGKGYWVNDEGETVHERMIPVILKCDEDSINKIADITAKHYNQDAIMFYKISDGVVIKNYKK